MRLITIEEHIKDQRILDEIDKYKVIPNPSSGDKELIKFHQEKTMLNDEILDVENIRLPYMDRCKIDMQVLSFLNPAEGVPEEAAIRICRQANDILAERVMEHPDRFAAFAALPLINPEEAAKELERCIKEHHFCGAMINGKINGHFLDEKIYYPIYETAARLDVPIYFHPSMVDKTIQDYYYVSKDDSWPLAVAREFASAGFGWHIDVGILVIRIILSGIFDKLPNLKLISGHWGEGIPANLDRLDSIMTKERTGLKENVSEYYKKHVYITPSGILSEINLEAMTKYMGAEHIIWAVDYPYVKLENIYDFLMNSNLTEGEKELIAYKNAERLLKNCNNKVPSV